MKEELMFLIFLSSLQTIIIVNNCIFNVYQQECHNMRFVSGFRFTGMVFTSTEVNTGIVCCGFL